MPTATELAVEHWDATPLFISEEQRYGLYPWLIEAGEFEKHAGRDVLEVGCGTGCDLLQFAKNGARATGIDVTPAHVRLARERVGGRARVVMADATRIPFADASFDYVYSHGVLHHMDEPRRAVEEIFRVLRPGGRFNVMLYSLFSLTTIGGILKHGRRWKAAIENSADPVRIDLYAARRLRRLFQPAAIEIRKYECHHAPFLQDRLGWFICGSGMRPAYFRS